MKTKKCFAVAVVAVGVVLLGGSPLWAQPVNPRIIQGLTQAQFLQNWLAAQQALPFTPAGFNPGFAPGGFVNPYTPSLGGFVNPYTPGGGVGSPFTPGGYGGGYPYTFIPPEGYFLQGAA